jgi:hypothetical protein
VLNCSEILIQGHTSRPQSYTVRKYREPTKQAQGKESFHEDEVHDHKFDGFGLFWEADAVARSLKGMSLSYLTQA